uniref:Uncharacterized protein LOC116943799 isoform X1 n=2 Tax=Petromyzon marinus TaxID=7757 RepID=A0AAJ7WWT7_PETMA|nr:uncharacterized protein LOC116943799 isoform X1 [Petromyzon marinus]
MRGGGAARKAAVTSVKPPPPSMLGHALKCHECNGVDQCKNSKPMECPADKAIHCITDFNGTSVAISKGCETFCPEGVFCCSREECNKRSTLLECFNCTDLACTKMTTKLCSKGGHYCYSSQVDGDRVSRGCRKECPEGVNVTCCQKDRCNIEPGNKTSGNGASDNQASGNSQPSKSPTTNKASGNGAPGKGDGNSAPGMSACLLQGLGLFSMATMMRLLQD